MGAMAGATGISDTPTSFSGFKKLNKAGGGFCAGCDGVCGGELILSRKAAALAFASVIAELIFEFNSVRTPSHAVLISALVGIWALMF